MRPDTLISTWDSLANEPASPSGMQRLRLDPEAAADIFACIFWPSRRLGLLIEGGGIHQASDGRIPACRGVRMVHEILPAPDERTILRIILEDERLLDIFAVLSADLVTIASAQASAAMALRRCIDRLGMWQGLLERVPADGLSEEQQRGMLGELLVMESLLLPHLDALAAVEAWGGPDPAHQDFNRAGLAIEVKTTLAKRHAKIAIANEKQLDERPHTALLLAHLRLDESAAHGDSLPMTVARLRSLLSQDPAASRLFDDRLFLGGFIDVHAPLYQSNRWRCSGIRYYRVVGSFPRLTEVNLPAGVGDIRYSIIADDLGAYELTLEDVVTLVEATDG